MGSTRKPGRRLLPLRRPRLGIALALFAESVSPGEAAPFAYVSSSGDNSVSVIDTATAKRVATIPMGVFPADKLPLTPFGLAVAPDGKHVYVTANTAALDTTIEVIETAGNRVAHTIPAGGDFAGGIGVAPDGKQAYAAISGPASLVRVIDTVWNQVAGAVPLPADATPGAIAVSPDGKQLYVTNESPGGVLVIDTAAGSVVATIPVGG
ncbi:MAG: hypothetical protein J2P49_07675, partial [Methylocapsa sp.]|nr:hypothetical protein [Methylocapsa sp.]